MKKISGLIMKNEIELFSLLIPIFHELDTHSSYFPHKTMSYLSQGITSSSKL
jgi:hypothetical protein